MFGALFIALLVLVAHSHVLIMAPYRFFVFYINILKLDPVFFKSNIFYELENSSHIHSFIKFFYDFQLVVCVM